MRVRDLPATEQGLLRACLAFVVESRELGGEFQTRMGISEAQTRDILDSWPDVDDEADDSPAVIGINSAMNEVCNGLDIRDWERWFTAPRADVRLTFAQWRRGRGWDRR